MTAPRSLARLLRTLRARHPEAAPRKCWHAPPTSHAVCRFAALEQPLHSWRAKPLQLLCWREGYRRQHWALTYPCRRQHSALTALPPRTSSKRCLQRQSGAFSTRPTAHEVTSPPASRRASTCSRPSRLRSFISPRHWNSLRGGDVGPWAPVLASYGTRRATSSPITTSSAGNKVHEVHDAHRQGR